MTKLSFYRQFLTISKTATKKKWYFPHLGRSKLIMTVWTFFFWPTSKSVNVCTSTSNFWGWVYWFFWQDIWWMRSLGENFGYVHPTGTDLHYKERFFNPQLRCSWSNYKGWAVKRMTNTFVPGQPNFICGFLGCKKCKKCGEMGWRGNFEGLYRSCCYAHPIQKCFEQESWHEEVSHAVTSLCDQNWWTPGTFE